MTSRNQVFEGNVARVAAVQPLCLVYHSWKEALDENRLRFLPFADYQE
jgi:hypothetical protein